MEETVKQLLQGFPSFAGLIICIAILKQQNDRLMGLLERFCKNCSEEDERVP